MTHKRTIFIVTFLLLTLSLVVSACGGSAEVVENPDPVGKTEIVAVTDGNADAGEALFAKSCAACHGANADGVAGLGPNLHNNAFIGGIDDAALANFIATGRAMNAPDNTTGIAMPPKGGNPALTANDLADIAAYLRSLQ